MKIHTLLVLILTSSSMPVLALTPVVDAEAIVRLGKQLRAMQKQYKVMSGTYQTAQHQLAAANKLNQLNSGHYHLGQLNNSIQDLKGRQWSANRWEDALNNIAGGNPKRYQQLVQAYEQQHHALPDATFRKGASSVQLLHYKQNKAVNEAVSIQTTYAFDDINTHLSAVHALSEHIEKTENTKSALDLNSRLLTEMLYIQIQTLKLQTLISQQTAQFGANHLDDATESATFNRLPD